MIPKQLHYIWFGNNPKPSNFESCLNSWTTHMSDYVIYSGDKVVKTGELVNSGNALKFVEEK